MPSGASTATIGEYWLSAHIVMRSSAAASAAGSASIIRRLWRSACALAAGMLTRIPAFLAAASAAETQRLEPLFEMTAIGCSTGMAGSARLILSVGRSGKYIDTTLCIAGSYFELGALTRFHPHQLQEPPRPPDALNRQLLA